MANGGFDGSSRGSEMRDKGTIKTNIGDCLPLRLWMLELQTVEK